MTDESAPRVTVALSSGIAFSMAHVGVLHALEEAGIPIAGISGCSGGAMVGALYAGGLTVPELSDAARSVRWRDIVEFNMPRMGFFSNERMERFVEQLIGDKTFQDLRIPLAIICCNLNDGDEIILRTGRVARAVRATCCIPQVFTPVDDNGRLLCDGGILNKVPVQVARSLGGDVVVAVDVGLYVRKTRVPTNIFEISSKVMSLVGEDRAERERASADIVVAPDLSRYSASELSNADEIIALGRMAMEEQLPALRALLEREGAGATFRNRVRAWWDGVA